MVKNHEAYLSVSDLREVILVEKNPKSIQLRKTKENATLKNLDVDHYKDFYSPQLLTSEKQQCESNLQTQ